MYAAKYSILFTILSVGLIASPLDSTVISVSEHVLSENKMLYFNSNGQIQIIERQEYNMHTGGVTIATAAQHNSGLKNADKDSLSKIEKRCSKHTVWSLNPTETYIDWDIPMTGVVQASPNSSVSVAVTQGFSIGNSLSVTSKSRFGKVENLLFRNIGVSYKKIWTLSYSTGYSFNIPAGKFGTVVINPLTTRHSGYIDIGCVSQANRIEFSGESYQAKSYSDNTWVEGLIGLCIGDTYPLHKCFGEGIL